MNELMVDYFIAVAKRQSFTKAADALFVSQPAISKQIALLEHELGFTLLDRAQKPIVLTEVGKLFFAFFNEQRAALQRLKEKAILMNTERSGSVILGCLDGWNVSSFFPQIIAAFSSKYPKIRLSLESRGFRGLLDALANKEIDAIISIDITLPDSENISVRRLTELPMIILYSSKHRLASLDTPTPAEFKNEVFFAVSDSEVSGVGEYIKAYCAPYGFEPKIEFLPNIDSVMLSVENGMGVTIGDYWSRLLTNSEIRHTMMQSNHIISIAWRNDNSNPAVNILVNELTFLFDSNIKEV